MRGRISVFLSLMLLGLGLFGLQALVPSLSQGGGAGQASVLTLDGPITPISAAYVAREITAADARGDAFVIIEIDTPGGLVDSMKSIVKSILAADTPVVTYVAPQGARSASAGLYIMYAAHVSAMAPATNTGSATPINMGGGDGENPFEDGLPEDPDAAPAGTPTDGETSDGATDDIADAAPATAEPVVEDISNEASLRGKIIEDSVAYIRALAQKRGRNADWAEKAVRPPSASITADEALALGVIDIVAANEADLLNQLDGRVVEVASGPVTIATKGVSLTRVVPTTIERILGFFADPNVAAILFTLGTTGLIVELWNPGSIFPGAMGLLCLILALMSFQVLPYDKVPMAIMGLGALLVFIEIFTPSFGLVGASGLVLFGLGLYFLFPDEFRVSPVLIGGVVGTAGLLLLATSLAIAGSRGHGPLIGQEAIRRREGRVEEWSAEKAEGYVIVDGERWRARSKDQLVPGDRIRVQDIDGIVLVVRRLQPASSGPLARFRAPSGRRAATS